MNCELLWHKFLDSIQKDISNLSYSTWFSETELYKIDNGIATVIVPMPIHKKHLNENYKDLITKTFNEIAGDNYEFEFLLKEEIESEVPSKVDDTIIEDEEKDNTPIDSNLKPEYTFESFIVGNSNKFAQASALAVAENPGKMYNPLFIYGSSGLGKTHLMHAIGNYIVEHSNKKVLYVTCEQFRDDYIGISRRMEEKGNNFDYVEYFKKKYRNIDVLMIDDIQFLGGANSTQQEFFHTFNSLYSDNKQIVITSDRSPDDLKLLEERLRTRFAWGLTVNIYPPEFELRVSIIKKKISGYNIKENIPDDVIEYIASNVGSDVRQLEGSVNRLLAYSTIMGGTEINLNLAIEALKDYTNTGVSDKNDIRKIQKAVAEYFQISLEDLVSKKRNANLAFPRQVAMYLCRSLTNESFPKIGTEFGGKDHSTVIHSCEKIEQQMKLNKELVKTIESIKKTIT